jgi:hypothetical protein
MKCEFPVNSFISVVFCFERQNPWAHAEKINILDSAGDVGSNAFDGFHQSQVSLDEFIFARAIQFLHCFDDIVRALTVSSNDDDMWGTSRVFRCIFGERSGNTCTNS